MNLNKVFILGNVTREPEVRFLPSGQQVTSFGVATNRFYTDSSGEKKQTTEFHNVVCFGKLADTSSRYLHKGSLVLIEGRIQTRNWVNSQGQKQYRTEIIAENMQLGPKTASSEVATHKQLAAEEPGSSIKQEDIPVIEEDYVPPPDSLQEEPKVSFEDNAAEEIDIKDIPF